MKRSDYWGILASVWLSASTTNGDKLCLLFGVVCAVIQLVMIFLVKD